MELSLLPILIPIGPNIRLMILFSNIPSLHSSFNIRDHAFQSSSEWCFWNKDDFYRVTLLASRQTLMLEDRSWSAVHDWLFSTFAYLIYLEVYYPIRNPRGRTMSWWKEPRDCHLASWHSYLEQNSILTVIMHLPVAMGKLEENSFLSSFYSEFHINMSYLNKYFVI